MNNAANNKANNKSFSELMANAADKRVSHGGLRKRNKSLSELNFGLRMEVYRERCARLRKPNK